ncbi:MAG TPA: pyroglutamyl-peptidase I [Xanthobacteraceae bacterium]|jgi:pyroglutamyl-peptidase
MTATILLTGFGPFPGAPFNPTGALVMELARRRIPALRNARRVAHVFPTSYAAVDRELPALLARERPDLLLMFGLASRRRHISIETHARNGITRAVADASGQLPAASLIVAGARATLPLRVPVQRLVAAARATRMPAALSGDAGSYLCNYLCWRASEAAERPGGPRLVAFVHVPNVLGAGAHVPTAHRLYRRRSPTRPPFRLDDLIRAGEAIMCATLAAAPRHRDVN